MPDSPTVAGAWRLLHDALDVAREHAEDTPGIAVGVVADGTPVLGFQGSTRAGGRAIDAGTRFGVCSITKPMTAALALSLVADPGSGLDAPLVTFLHELRDDGP